MQTTQEIPCVLVWFDPAAAVEIRVAPCVFVILLCFEYRSKRAVGFALTELPFFFFVLHNFFFQIDDKLLTNFSLFLLVISSCYRMPINLVILSLMESGELTKLQNKWWYDQTKCNTLGGKPHEVSNNGLMLNNLAGLFFVLIGGLMISLLVAVIEFCFKHGDPANKQQKYKNKTTAATVNTLQAKSKLTIQQGRDFDNGRVGVGFLLSRIH